MNFKPFIFSLFGLAILISFATCCKDDPAPRKGKTSAVFNPDKEYGTVKDIDGNEYKTITIGTQTWMAENLRVTRYSNGDPITFLPLSVGNGVYHLQTQGVYCAYDDTADPDSIATYGLLYNGYAVMDERDLCPDGWHVPTTQEWDTLAATIDLGDGYIDQYGSNSVVGGRLKEVGLRHWNTPNPADNSSGFTALPGGNRYGDTYYLKGEMALFWTSTAYSTSLYPGFSDTSYKAKSLFIRTTSDLFTTLGNQVYPMDAGKSVRCIRNN